MGGTDVGAIVVGGTVVVGPDVGADVGADLVVVVEGTTVGGTVATTPLEGVPPAGEAVPGLAERAGPLDPVTAWSLPEAQAARSSRTITPRADQRR